MAFSLPASLRKHSRFTTLSMFVTTVAVAVILYFFAVSFNVNRTWFFTRSRTSASGPASIVVTSYHDVSKHQQLFQFSNVTTLNFMHLHKTGGTSMKNAFYKAYNKCTKHYSSTAASKVLIEGSCRRRTETTCPSCSNFACSWTHLLGRSPSSRNLIDIAFGHQFLHGQDSLPTLLNQRIVTSFTILRHPFARKFSMFFHFLVRNAGVDAKDISVADIVPYLLREEGRIKDNTRQKLDSGPNYYAGRLLSEGIHTYYHDKPNKHKYFKVTSTDTNNNDTTVIDKANEMLNTFAMTAVYEWPRTTQCVTKRMLQAFDDALQIQRREQNSGSHEANAADVFAELMSGTKLNKGHYHDVRNASSVWNGLTVAQRREFEKHERIDMQIYEHGVDLFIAQAVRVGCAKNLEEDVDEMESGTGAAGDGDFDGLLSKAVKRFRDASATQ